MINRYGLWAMLLLFSTTLSAQTTLYQERFPGGNPELVWISGDGVSQLKTVKLGGNPSADSTVGYVRGQAAVGNTGQILAGATNLKNYRVARRRFWCGVMPAPAPEPTTASLAASFRWARLSRDMC